MNLRDEIVHDNVRLWITKYALSKGVLVFDGCHVTKSDTGTVYGHVPFGPSYGMLFSAREFHFSLAEAEARVVEMVADKQKSLAKQAKKLESYKAKLFENEKSGYTDQRGRFGR